MNYYAHTAVNSDGTPDPDTARWQLLSTHLRNVADLGERFGEPLGLGAEAWLAGVRHDLGNHAKRFQARLHDNSIHGINHWAAGNLLEYWAALLVMTQPISSKKRQVTFRFAVGTRKPNARRSPNISTGLSKCNALLDVLGTSQTPKPHPSQTRWTHFRAAGPWFLPPRYAETAEALEKKYLSSRGLGFRTGATRSEVALSMR